MRQDLQQKQRLILTQGLKQSMKVLELAALELKDMVEDELSENPAVEEVPGEPRETQQLPVKEAGQTAEPDNLPPFAREVVPSELLNYHKPIPARKETLADALLRQLRIAARDEKELQIGTCIINHINENGYLRDELTDVCKELPCLPEEAEKALNLIQTFDPAGVGGRGLKECLLIQLQRAKKQDSLAIRLVQEHLQKLAKDSPEKLAKKTKCDVRSVLEAIAKIRCLEPKPGRRYGAEEVAYVIPDITIEEKDGLLVTSTKEEHVPRIRINPTYKNMLNSPRVDERAKEFIRGKIRKANDLIRAILQRRSTLAQAADIIAERQKEAVLGGMKKLKPLTLREVAQQLEMNESTVSRIVMNKYVQTPYGIFSLRSFFSSGLKSVEGEDVSSQSIKLKIKELIDCEDKLRPLTDQQIVQRIHLTENTILARRTIAKYRDTLNISPASKRKRPNLK